MRVRRPAEQAESTETERFKKSRGPLLSAREAGPRTEVPDEEALEQSDRAVSPQFLMLASPCYTPMGKL